MAVVMPVLLIFTFGILEVTNAIYLQESLTICAYEGARVALLPDTDATTVRATCDKMLLARHVSGATVTITPNDFDSRVYGTEIEVAISAELADNLITPMIVLTNQTLLGNVIMMKES